MSFNHDPPSPPSRVREPVQVYLDAAGQERLERLRSRLGTTKSDVLRRGLASLERELTEPAAHPVLRIIGIVPADTVAPDPGYDPAREHDRFLAEEEEASRAPGSQEPDGGR